MVPFLPCVSSFWHYKRPPPPCRTWQVVSSIKKPLQLNYSSSTKVPQKNGVNSKIRRFFLSKYGNEVPVPYDFDTEHVFFWRV